VPSACLSCFLLIFCKRCAAHKGDAGRIDWSSTESVGVSRCQTAALKTFRASRQAIVPFLDDLHVFHHIVGRAEGYGETTVVLVALVPAHIEHSADMHRPYAHKPSGSRVPCLPNLGK
jgi:hypothetical protein